MQCLFHDSRSSRGGKFDSNNYGVTLLPGVGVHTDFNLAGITFVATYPMVSG